MNSNNVKLCPVWINRKWLRATFNPKSIKNVLEEKRTYIIKRYKHGKQKSLPIFISRFCSEVDSKKAYGIKGIMNMKIQIVASGKSTLIPQ